MHADIFLSAFLGSGVGFAVVVFLSKSWIAARIEQSIKHEYDLKTEKFREASIIKAKSQVIAELLAEWLSHRDDQRRLNQLTLEAFLWLPEDILHDLSNLLSHKTGAPDIRQLVVRVREHLLGSSSLPDHEVIVFPQETLAKMAEQQRKETDQHDSVEAE